MVWADFGYSANVQIADFAEDDPLLATHCNGTELTPEHGYPVRVVVPGRYAWKSVKWVRAVEYLTRDRRGFWEEGGYHKTAAPWRDQRYPPREPPGEGPPLSRPAALTLAPLAICRSDTGQSPSCGRGRPVP